MLRVVLSSIVVASIVLGCAQPASEADDFVQDTDDLTTIEEWALEWGGARMNDLEKEVCTQSRLRCIAYLRAGKDAHDAAAFELRDGTNGGRQDAFRHALWNAMMTTRMEEEWAKRFADAHENGYAENFATPANLLLTEMDLFNNEVGRQIGLRGGDDEQLKAAVRDALIAGELRAIRYHLEGYPDGKLVSTSECSGDVHCGA